MVRSSTALSRSPSLSVLRLPRLINIKAFKRIIKKYLRFIGPGLMVSVAYMDPGNYSTAVAAGSAYQYKLLFLILLSNCLAIFLQILSARLGCVTGLDLATNCRLNLPPKVNFLLYIMAEIAIIATDLAEVVGTAIALNILFNLPLIAGVVITIIDVLIVLMAYRPKGPLLFIRIFESFVSVLVAATVVCFGIELFQVSHDETIDFKPLDVLKGFLPNEKVVDLSDRDGGGGLFLSLAILGATVMPHSLYLGSGLVQTRLKDFDLKHGFYRPNEQSSQNSPAHEVQPSNSESGELESDQLTQNIDSSISESDPFLNQNKVDNIPRVSEVEQEQEDEEDYRPSIHAINDIMSYTIVELVVSLFTVALFVNSAILIVAGATLKSKQSKFLFFLERNDDDDSDSDDDDDYDNADLFTIYHLLSTHLSSTAGLVFALALLFSGQSAGIVCTLAGQMVLEGFLLWSLPPITRRLITRGLAIIPCLLVVGMSGREGLSNVLNFSQVVLSLLLPFVTAPLILFTCSKEIMRVPIFNTDYEEGYDLEIDAPLARTSSSRRNSLGGDTVFNVDTHTSNSKVNTTDSAARYKSSEPAIRLQDLRNSHPCAGFDDDDEESGRIQLNNSNKNPEQGYDQQYLDPQDRNRFKVSDSPVKDGTRSRKNSQAEPIAYTEDDSTIHQNSTYRVKGYRDLSNGPITAFLAILVWGFITVLNLFLIGSLFLGYDVPI